MRPKELVKSNTLSYQLRTFVFAFRGILTFFKLESKALFHLIAAMLAVGLSWYLHISKMEWLFILLAIGLVFIAELFNTIAEYMADMIQPELDKKVANIKDMAAGAVLIAAIVALLIGLIIFIPGISSLL